MSKAKPKARVGANQTHPGKPCLLTDAVRAVSSGDTRESNKTATKPTRATQPAINSNKCRTLEVTLHVIGTRDRIDTARTVRRHEPATRNDGYLRKKSVECHVTQVAESERNSL